MSGSQLARAERNGAAYPFLLWVAVFAALCGSFYFGYQLGVLNPVLEYTLHSLDVEMQYGSLIVSSVLVGALLGSLGAGSLADNKGPKVAIMMATVPSAVGSVVSGVSWSAGSLVLGRMLCGIGVGSASILTPRYLAEIAPKTIRGAISSLNQICICFGILFAFILGSVYEKQPEYEGWMSIDWWRWMMVFGCCISALQGIVIAFCPETPVWLIWNGLHLQATASYHMLHGAVPDDMEQDDERAEEDTRMLVATESQYRNRRSRRDSPDSSGEISWRDVLHKKYRRIVRLACVIPVSQQFSGINVIILYGANVMKMIGMSDSPMRSNMILGAINALFAILSAILVDRVGRKPCLVASFTGMCVCLFTLALSVGGSEPSHPLVAFWSLVGYICFFGVGCGGIPWVYLSEILPDEIKKDLQAVATAGNWLANLFVGASFSAFVALIGIQGLYLFYACCCALSAAFCVWYMVETKQKPLHQIHRELLILE